MTTAAPPSGVVSPLRVLDRDDAGDQARLRAFVCDLRRRGASPADQDPDQQTHHRHQPQQGALHVQNAARNGNLVRVQGRSKPGLRRALLVLGGVDQFRFRIVDEKLSQGIVSRRASGGHCVGRLHRRFRRRGVLAVRRGRNLQHLLAFRAFRLRTGLARADAQTCAAMLTGKLDRHVRRESLRRVTRRGNLGDRRRLMPAAPVRPVRVACR